MYTIITLCTIILVIIPYQTTYCSTIHKRNDNPKHPIPPIVIPETSGSSHSSTNTPRSPHAQTPPPIPRINAFSPEEIARIRAGAKGMYN